MAVAAAALIAPASALAAAGPPTLASAFAPSTIPVGGTSTLSFTITNPNATKLTGVGFSETLPAGLAVDTPSGQSGTCGSSGVLTATAGGSSITLAGGSLAPNANCVVSVNVTSSTPGSYANNSVGATSTEGGAGTGDTQTLQVAGLPRISVTAPRNKATFAFGQKVRATFTCTDGTGGPGINDCEGDDQQTGATYASGQLLDTSTPGTHTVTFLAVSSDSGQTTEDITYTVRPDNRVTASTPRTGAHGRLSLALKVPGAGRLSVIETEAGAKHATIASATVSVGAAKTLRLTLKPTRAASKLLAALTKGETLPAKLTIAFTPRHGVKASTTVGGIALKR
jgi:hypothetical protein